MRRPRVLTINGGSSRIRFAVYELGEKRNGENAPLISQEASRVKVRVIHTDEELMIARAIVHVLDIRSQMETRP